jgi:hypothetical protein
MNNNEIEISEELKHDKNACLEYIQIQWRDIYHMQREDFGILGGLGVTVTILHYINADEILYLMGLIGAIFGALVANQHYNVFNEKIHVISKLEECIGIIFPKKHSRFTTQLLIYLFYIALFAIFFTIFLHHLLKGIPHFILYKTKIEWDNIIGIIIFMALILPRLTKVIRNDES